VSSLAAICSKRVDAIPKWQFWRNWEREFWFGGILAEYARHTGDEAMEARANAIFEKYHERIAAKYAKTKEKIKPKGS